MAVPTLGPGSPCPCGSGKRWGDCCYEDFARTIAEKNAEIERHRRQYGEVREVVHMEHQGNRFVAVGGKLIVGKWRTFTDFLMDYLVDVLGGEWMKAQMKAPAESRHPLAAMRADVVEFTATQEKGADGLYFAEATGPLAGYVNVAYDAWVLDDRQKLQQEVVNRLRHPDQYQGARYELYAAATCVRAGFDLDYEDESDGSKKHPEFMGVHQPTSQTIAVEAKSRHRPGVLGQPGTETPADELRADVGRLVNRAIAKDPGVPFVIFVDLNLPPFGGDDAAIPAEDLVGDLSRMLDRIDKQSADGTIGYNLVVFSNQPHQYGDAYSVDPPRHVVAVTAPNPRFPLDDPEPVHAILRATEQYGNVPSKFPGE